MSVSLKGFKFEHTELSINFESFNDEFNVQSLKKPRTQLCCVRNQN